jgi:hypothetical protein
VLDEYMSEVPTGGRCDRVLGSSDAYEERVAVGGLDLEQVQLDRGDRPISN